MSELYKVTSGNLGEPQLYMHGERICSEADFLRVKDRIEQLEVDLKASREREVALAIRLRVIRNDHGCSSPADEAWLRRNGYKELADALFSENDQAILAAHDAEVRKPLEDRIAVLEVDLAAAQKATKYQSGLCDRAIREQPEIKRKAKVEALESVWDFLDYNSSIDQQVFLCDKFQAYIAALKAEGGKG